MTEDANRIPPDFWTGLLIGIALDEAPRLSWWVAARLSLLWHSLPI